LAGRRTGYSPLTQPHQDKKAVMGPQVPFPACGESTTVWMLDYAIASCNVLKNLFRIEIYYSLTWGYYLKIY